MTHWTEDILQRMNWCYYLTHYRKGNKMKENLDTLRFNLSQAIAVKEQAIESVGIAVRAKDKAFFALVDGIFSEANKYNIPADFLSLNVDRDYRDEIISKINAKYDEIDGRFPYPEYVSNCCNARVIEETDLCQKCGEHCEPIEIKNATGEQFDTMINNVTKKLENLNNEVR